VISGGANDIAAISATTFLAIRCIILLEYLI
jgi:hypothetical protein